MCENLASWCLFIFVKCGNSSKLKLLRKLQLLLRNLSISTTIVSTNIHEVAPYVAKVPHYHAMNSGSWKPYLLAH